MIVPSFDIPALQLKKQSSGKIIERLWYPFGDLFSFFDFFFTLPRGSSPEVYGAWMFGQEDVRRYIFSFTDFYLLYTELCYVAENPDTAAEVELHNVFETRCLGNITAWQAPLKIMLSSSEAEVTLDFQAHPAASATYTFHSRRLLFEFTRSIHQKWCSFIPALNIQGLWVIALGGAYSLFREKDDTEEELMIMSSEVALEFIDTVLQWDGEPAHVVLGSLQIDFSEEDLNLHVLDVSFILSIREAEALASFLERRLFLSESGNFLKWKDTYSKKYAST